MSRQFFKLSQFLVAMLGGALLSGLASVARADVSSHAQVDTFAVDAASLVPAGIPPVAALTAPLDRITLGEWGPVIPWTPHIPVTAVNLPDGRVLTFASSERTSFPGLQRTYAATWNPATGQFVEYNHLTHDMFCGGIVMLRDGQVLVSGANFTDAQSSLFDWRVNTWTRTPDMNDPRWYNTTVALPNGRAWTVSGEGGPGTAERWDSVTGWSRQTGINWNLVLADPGYLDNWHPFLVIAPDGRLFHFGPTDTMHWVSTDGSGSLVNAGTVVPGGHYPKEGSWAMYDEGRILVAGGGASTAENPNEPETGVSTNVAYTVDVRTGTPVVTPAVPMTYKRSFANSVILPNGEVMVIGGNTVGIQWNDTGSIFIPEVWNPNTGLWRPLANIDVPRNYHSIGLLLPDGRVLSGGGGLYVDSSKPTTDHRDAQIFTPPTLFNADGSLATRPVLTNAPTTIGVATTFNVTGTPAIQKFSFIKMSAVTHSMNTDLRYLSLPFVETSPGYYQINAHNNLNVMTPGYWMLFGLDAAGVHSVAKIIFVDSIGLVSISAPGNQALYVGSAASLQMTGSGPVGSVLSWSATNLPTGLAINPTTGLISGTPTVLGSFPTQVALTDSNTSATVNFTWLIQPVTFNRNYNTFNGAGGLTLNSNAALVADVLRLTPNLANRVGSAFISNSIPIGPNTSISTRWVYRIHGTANGGEGLAFIIQGNGPTSIGSGGGGLGYGGMLRSVAVEIDNAQGTGDPNANHLGILTNGVVTSHRATNTPAWDLENELSHTLWVDYDGPANQLRVYAAQGDVAVRPPSPALTAAIDLPALVVDGQAWLGFSGGTGSTANNHDIESWSVTVNAFALLAPPVLTGPDNMTNVLGYPLNFQMQATDPNGDLLTWSATNLPNGLSINPSSGLISGTPTVLGVFSVIVTVTDSNTPPVSTNFSWTINDLLAIQPLSGAPVAAGTTVALDAQIFGGLNPTNSWSFGDGSPDTAYSVSTATSHTFTNAGRYLVTITVRDDRGSDITASYYQSVYATSLTARPPASTSIVYESRTNANSRLWAVNPDNDSVTVFDAITLAKLAEINVGTAPRSIALAPDGRVWVANAESATVTIIQTNYTIAQTVSLARGSRPFGLVFDPAGLNAYVALEASGKILKLNPSTGATVATLDVGPNVRHLSVTADASRILATRFITPRLPGEETASPQTTVLGVKYGGEVLTINRTNFTIISTVILEHSEEADTPVSARGIPNYLGAAVISPDGLSAWVPSKQDNIKRGALRNTSDLTHDMSIRSIASRINLATQTEDINGRVDFDNGGIASAAAFDPQGIFLFAALEGSREVAVSDPVAKQEIMRIPVGRAPQGLVVSPDGRTLFVQNFMDRTISVHDLDTLVNGSVSPLPAPVVLESITTEKLASNVLIGKKFFYDAQDSRVALQQYISCAACHNDGGQDGRIWDFTQFGEGLRNTITLRGHGGTNQGRLHWTGNFDEVQDFEGQIRNFAGGTGLMSNSVFHAGTRSQPLGDTKAGLSSDLDALAAYVASLTKNGDSPDRNANGTLTSTALAGQVVFQQQNCAQCHSGSQFTDSALNVFHDVGTLKPSSGQRLGAALTGLDTPTLSGLWANAPYLHDGSAATIEAAVAAHNGVSIAPADMTNLVAFLRQLDDVGLVETTFGNTNDGISTDGIGNGVINVARFQATDDLLVTKMYAQVEGIAGNYKCAIYGGSEFGPSNLLQTTAEVSNPTTGWQTFPLTSPQSLTNEQYYWLAIWSDDSNSRVFYSDQAGTIQWQSYVYGTWPDPISTPDSGGFTYCIYASGTVVPKLLTVTGIVASNKVYDSGTIAILNTAGATLVGVTGGQTVTLNTASAAGIFNTPTVGNGKLVQISGLTISGAHATNYMLVQPTATANITPKSVMPVIVAANKVYDGSAAATLSNQSVTGTLGADVLMLGVGTANFDTKNVGTSKIVIATNLSLSGVSAGNYVLGAAIVTNLANITPLGINGDFTVAAKPYDANTTATVLTRMLNGVLAGDTNNVSLDGGTANFADANVGTNKIVTLTGASLLGSASANYNLSSVDTATAAITTANLLVTADNQNRVYGLTNPILTASYTGFAGAETLATSGVTGSPVLITVATNTSLAGDYPIMAALGSLSATNYSFSFAAGVLTIIPSGNVIITSVVRMTNNSTHFSGIGVAGVIYTIQTSTNLINWQDIGNATASTNGIFEFEDTNTAYLNRCFYRVALP